MIQFFEELKKRNVYKVGTAYVVTSYSIIEVINTLGNNLRWPPNIAEISTIILIIGFPIALLFTWLYEFTPQGLKLTGKVQQDTTDNRRAGRLLNKVIIGVLAVTICFMLVERLFLAGFTSINTSYKASIGVLPFLNMSSEEENGYFADGITEAILDKLGKITSLQVPARTSSFKYKGVNEDVRKIAEQLGVNYILEGSVQYDRVSNRVKITVQLINASTGYHLSSNTYEEPFEEVFTIQEEISRKVVSELRANLLPEEERTLSDKLTQNSEAYKLYLKSRVFSQKRDQNSLQMAINFLNQALDLDNNFAVAHAELSFLYNQLNVYGNLSKEERDKKVNYHLTKAVEIASDIPQVLRAEANYLHRNNKDSSKVIAKLRKAIRINPNYADAHYDLFRALSRAKLPVLGLKSLEEAYKLDPLNEFYGSTLADRYSKYDIQKTYNLLDKIIENDSLAERSRRMKGLYLADAPFGDLVGAFKLFYEALRISPYSARTLNYLSLILLDLDLYPTSKKYARISQMRYQENYGSYLLTTELFSFSKDFSVWQEYIDYWSLEKGLNLQDELYDRTSLQKGIGNFDVAIELLEKGLPELSSPSLSTDMFNNEVTYDLILRYTDLLWLTNDNQRASKFARQICNYSISRIKDSSVISSDKRNDLQLDCAYISNDTNGFIILLGERFFTHKDRLGVFTNIIQGKWKRFEDNNEYQALIERITEETHRMRAEVVEYLKEEGDWDPSWDKELGLE